ncbi:MAG: PhzF family phenazine biosynthesis protein [Gemmatimonadota bacterium]
MSGGLRYLLADVFTDRAFGGNQLAVFPDGGSVPPELMPRIARELNLSETVFVLPPERTDHTARMRIFTPGSELPFAGHPTVGTACILVADGRVETVASGKDLHADLMLEQVVGPIRVRVRSSDDGYSAQFDVPRLPEFGPEAPAMGELAEALSLREDDLAGGAWQPQAVSCGVPFLMVPVRDRGALARARLNTARWERLLEPYWAPHVYVTTRDVELEGSSIRARMFAPGMGIDEDPATGAAASALSGYLAAREPADTPHLSWRIEQGLEMGRPSIIEVEADQSEGRLTAVRVGGGCVMMGEGMLDLPGALDRA